jgi:HlyD family secretion protein
MKRTWLLILLGVLGVTVSVAAYYRSGGTAAEPRFLTAPVARGDVVNAIEATGTLEAVETVEVGSQVSGTIKSLQADFNSVVKAGQVIAQLEPSLFEAQVEQARSSLLRLEADLDRAKVALEDADIKLRRARELWDMQLIAKTDLEAAEATFRQAQASIKSADAQLAQGQASLNQNQVNLSHTVIRAPIDGIVISRNVNVGQTVAASMSAPVLFVIAKDLSRMRVNANIDESDIGRIAAGQSALFTVDAYPGERFPGVVSQVRLQPVVESNVVSYVTIIDVANRGLKLKPGMTANVTVEISRQDDTLRVPTSALRFRPDAAEGAQTGAAGGRGRTGGDSQVWVLREDVPQPVTVRARLSDGTTTAVVSDALHEGDRVITGSAAASGSSNQPAQSPLMPTFNGRGRGTRGGAAR